MHRMKEMIEMKQVQQILVEDHIDGLKREAAALRAERAFHARGAPQPATSGSRQRVGRWLVAAGQAIAGGSVEPDCGQGDPVAGAV